MSASRPPSPLELLHPDGAADGPAVLGGGCPPWIASGLPEHGGDRAGLVVVAPAAAEARDPGWVRETARTAARVVAADGLVYALVPSLRRAALVRALARAGLVPETALVHLPRLESWRHLATADRRALGYALGSLVAPTPRRRAAAALAAAAGPLPFRLLAGAGVVLRPPGARPLLGWIRALAPRADPSCAVLARTWREEGGASLVHVFGPSGAEPAAVAKVRSASAHAAQEAERRALESVATGARLAGVETPAPLAAGIVGGRPALLTSALPGRPAAAELGGRPELVPPLLDRLGAWIDAWNRATSDPDGLPAAELEARLVEPVRALAAHLPDAGAYEAWLRGLCARAGRVPAVAAHNDLTTANVLLARDGRLGVVDWESARERDLPLGDLVYATVDAHLHSRRFRSRADAFDASYAGVGQEADAARRHLAHHRRALGLNDAALVACIHACWLAHAANDARRVPGQESEFVVLAAHLARDREALAERLAGR